MLVPPERGLSNNHWLRAAPKAESSNFVDAGTLARHLTVAGGSRNYRADAAQETLHSVKEINIMLPPDMLCLLRDAERAWQRERMADAGPLAAPTGSVNNPALTNVALALHLANLAKRLLA